MFLDYFALGVLIFASITLFYAVIAIHDIPYELRCIAIIRTKMQSTCPR
jgi:hypothetical protein